MYSARRLGVGETLLVAAACGCARLALRHIPPGETRPLKCIETAEAWTRGEATGAQVQAAAMAAYHSAYSGDDAAGCAAFAAWGAATEGRAAYAALSAVVAESSREARDAMHQQCAVVVREVIPYESFDRL